MELSTYQRWPEFLSVCHAWLLDYEEGTSVVLIIKLCEACNQKKQDAGILTSCICFSSWACGRHSRPTLCNKPWQHFDSHWSGSWSFADKIGCHCSTVNDSWIDEDKNRSRQVLVAIEMVHARYLKQSTTPELNYSWQKLHQNGSMKATAILGKSVRKCDLTLFAEAWLKVIT